MQKEQIIDKLNHIEIRSDRKSLDIVWRLGMKDQEPWTVDSIIF